MSSDRSANHFVKGAAILGIAGLLSKVLGAVYRIPYQNIAGDIGLYVYMQVYPLYTTLLILATAGFPIAISKIVSERLAVGDPLGARKTFRVASTVLGVLGILFFLLLYFGAPLIASIMGDEHLILPLRAVSWSLPLVPVAAIMRGYFQGHQNMIPTGVSQVVEQLVRVIVIIFAAYWAMSAYDDAYLAGTGAVFAALPGAFAAVVVLFYYWRRTSRSQAARIPHGYRQRVESVSNREVLRSIWNYALPICVGALVLPLIPLVDGITVSNLLQWSGLDKDQAVLLKGAFDRGQPLIQFGTFFATSLSLALVPAISEAVAQQKHQVISYRTEVALRLTVLLGLPASFGLSLLAEPINIMLYGDSNGTEALAIQAFTILFATLSIATSGILQGLGKVVLPARHLFFGVLAKLLLNLAFVPLWGISGAALATVIAYLLAMSLNFKAILRYTGAKLRMRQIFGKPFLSTVLMSVIVLFVEKGLYAVLAGGANTDGRLIQTVVALGAVSAGLAAYAVALLVTGGLTRSDMRFLPKGERLASLLTRLKLLRKE
ncbi:putative polysaccharide biosynthesis protein [Brevibacillus massiliensis]|jgi:O-antigen/teichoic acid export membrane protein|uniref:putative polysaccharide biosynthesis protein n=1 Tax=Brevibacillus massiliensis TaxID=1118054 RepID=UPI0002D3EAF4|nr:polysaccharide biosynthesis protein [Brevibacillus massiliensis]